MKITRRAPLVERARRKRVDKLSDEETGDVNIPTDVPLVHVFHKNGSVAEKYHSGVQDEIVKRLGDAKGIAR